jgi:hypothetical protein
MTVVRHGYDHELSSGGVGVAGAHDPTRAIGRANLDGDDLCSFRATASNEHVVPGRGESCGETPTLGAGAAQDPDLHADAWRCMARSGRVATRAGRMVMGSIVMRVSERGLSVA